jgi:tRNA (adenine-N(1)-)-methyltransferase non-catalytic subunit
MFAMVADGTLLPVSRVSLQPWSSLAEDLINDEYSHDNKSVKPDNRRLNDNNEAQNMDAVSIRAMKEGGKSGAAIIEALASGSSTWGMKTDYSKAKWLKRKTRKYMPWVQILEPTSLSVAEALFMSTMARKQACRPDVVSQLLARGNLRAGSHVIVMDSLRGTVLGPIAERTGPRGNILFLHEGSQASIDALVRSTIPRYVRQSILSVTLECHQQSLTLQAQHTNAKVPCCYHTASKHELTWRLLQNLSFKSHALVFASQREPVSMLKVTLPALLVGCPIVLYSEHIEPLTRAFAWLKASGFAACLELTEAWHREFQVVVGCSHPTMTMSADAGYVLSAVKTANMSR